MRGWSSCRLLARRGGRGCVLAASANGAARKRTRHPAICLCCQLAEILIVLLHSPARIPMRNESILGGSSRAFRMRATVHRLEGLRSRAGWKPMKAAHRACRRVVNIKQTVRPEGMQRRLC